MNLFDKGMRSAPEGEQGSDQKRKPSNAEKTKAWKEQVAERRVDLDREKERAAYRKLMDEDQVERARARASGRAEVVDDEALRYSPEDRAKDARRLKGRVPRDERSHPKGPVPDSERRPVIFEERMAQFQKEQAEDEQYFEEHGYDSSPPPQIVSRPPKLAERVKNFFRRARGEEKRQAIADGQSENEGPEPENIFSRDEVGEDGLPYSSDG